jgi:hypothetical protein
MKGWLIVKKVIALMFVAAFLAATVIGCGSTTAPKVTPTTTKAP